MKRESARQRAKAGAANDNPETDVVKPRKRGGRVHGAKPPPRPDRRAHSSTSRDTGGGLPAVPNVDVQFVPQVQSIRGGGPPSPPGLPQQQQGNPATDAVNALKAGEDLGKMLKAKPGDSNGGNARGGAVRRGHR